MSADGANPPVSADREWFGRRARLRPAGLLQARALRETWPALVGSRLLVWTAGAGTAALLGLGPARKVLHHEQLTHGFGAVGDLLVAPAARWDAGWYLLVAAHGYAPGLGAATAARSVFFPLYPLLVAAASVAPLGAIGAGVLISVASFAVALYLLHRLTALETAVDPAAGGPLQTPRAVLGGLDTNAAPRMTVAVMAFAPMAFFFSAVYSEALFLALSVGVFWCARTGRWVWVGILGALASATRPTGVLLLVPAAIVYLYGPRTDRPRPVSETWARSAAAVGLSLRSRLSTLAAALRPRYRLRPDALWLALMPAGTVAFAAYLGLAGGGAMSPFSEQQLWGRRFAGPFGGLWSGAVAAVAGARQLLSLQGHHSYLPAGATGAPLVSASHDVVLFLFLVGALVALVGVLRVLPAAYGAYSLLALALPLSYPVSGEPLMSLPRFALVLFPLGMWMGGWLAAHPRARAPALACSAAAMVFFTAAFATWHWVS